MHFLFLRVMYFFVKENIYFKYGHVMSVNIVREGDCGFIKCFGFIEFSERKCIDNFIRKSNHV